MSDLLTRLRWRYAVKQYDPARRLRDDQLTTLLEAVRLAPSSNGLQPYQVFVVRTEAVRAQLRAASYQQAQITEASHLLVFAIETQLDEAYIDRYFELLSRERQVPVTESLLKHRQSVVASVGRLSPAGRLAWATNQAYLALGVLVVAAAELGIDANPMEGFVADQYDELLGLRAQGLHAVVIAGLGYRHPADRYQHLPKVRRLASELFHTR